MESVSDCFIHYTGVLAVRVDVYIPPLILGLGYVSYQPMCLLWGVSCICIQAGLPPTEHLH